MIRTNPLSVLRIKKVADEIRKSYSIPLDTFFPIYDYINELCDNNVLNLQILEDDDEVFSDGKIAFYNPRDNFIYIKDSVDAELNEGVYRSNFTLAHELFHYMQVQVLNFKFEEVDEVEPFRDPEWQANEFAAQLLIPEEYVGLDAEELVEKFHVSIEAALTRKVKKQNRSKK